MPISEARSKANKKYHQKFDDIKIRVPRGERQVWQDFAASKGESLNTFVCRVVNDAIRHDKTKPEE